MIYLTGDVHNHLGRLQDPGHRRIHEPSAAVEYARMAADLGIKVTFFVTGLALREAPEDFQTLSSLDNVELAAHGWDSFCRNGVRTLLWAFSGSRYGPKPLQAFDLRRTLKAFRETVGGVPTAWRGHAFYADQNTYPLLAGSGIKVVSDANVEDRSMPARIAQVSPGLWSLPINTMPDHDSLIHGGLTQSAIDDAAAACRALRDLQVSPGMSHKQRGAIRLRRSLRHICDIQVMPCSGELLYADRDIRLLPLGDWERALEVQIEDRVSSDGFATLLLHPVCMAAADGFEALQRILKICGRYETRFVTEAVPVVVPADRPANSPRANSDLAAAP